MPGINYKLLFEVSFKSLMIALIALVVTCIGLLAVAITRAENRSAEDLVYLPSKYFFSQPDFIEFSGTWTLVDEKIGTPKNWVRYQCDINSNKCSILDVTFMGSAFSADTSEVNIQSWNNERVVIDLPGSCRNGTVIVDLITQEIAQYTKNNPDAATTCILPRLDGVRKAIMIDGSKLPFSP